MLHSGVYAFLCMPNVTPVDGAHPIVVDGQLVGAISAAGGSFEDDNEVCFGGLAVFRSMRSYARKYWSYPIASSAKDPIS